MKKNIFNTEHYYWGSTCEGWHLVKSKDLSVIQEKMPPRKTEEKHYHEHSQQFFYILSGVAKFEINGEIITVSAGEGIHVEPKIEHRILNETNNDLHFLVISQPTTKGDRHNAP
ncbi:MAG: cupin domain-containing protein [Bacteroidia bacterium]|nr:cupin domain-containing protein [Bacteroidia bacterium]